MAAVVVEHWHASTGGKWRQVLRILLSEIIFIVLRSHMIIQLRLVLEEDLILLVDVRVRVAVEYATQRPVLTVVVGGEVVEERSGKGVRRHG